MEIPIKIILFHNSSLFEKSQINCLSYTRYKFINKISNLLHYFMISKKNLHSLYNNYYNKYEQKKKTITIFL